MAHKRSCKDWGKIVKLAVNHVFPNMGATTECSTNTNQSILSYCNFHFSHQLTGGPLRLKNSRKKSTQILSLLPWTQQSKYCYSNKWFDIRYLECGGSLSTCLRGFIWLYYGTPCGCSSTKTWYFNVFHRSLDPCPVFVRVLSGK